MDHYSDDEFHLDASRLEAITYIYPNSSKNVHFRTRPDLNKYVDDNLPTLKYPLSTAESRQSSTTSLGLLDPIPLEVLQICLAQLDLRTLANFRLVNRSAAATVESVPEYTAIIKCAPQTIRSILSVGTGHWITCARLYEQLYTHSCAYCGNFGDRLWILSCKRVCHGCLSGNWRCLPIWKERAMDLFGLNDQALAKLPHMRILPCLYGDEDDKFLDSTFFWDYESAEKEGVTLHGSTEAMKRFIENKEMSRKSLLRPELVQRHRIYTQIMKFAHRTGPGTTIRGFDYLSRQTSPFGETYHIRYMAAVSFPSFSRDSHEPEWGFYCRACEHDWVRSRRLFNLASFKKHLRICGDIRDGRHIMRV